MAPVNQTNGEVLRSDPSAEARRGNPTTTDESLRMIISPLSQLITMRLEDDNFLMWRYQIENVVRGYGLEGFLFGTEHLSPKMVIDGTGILVPNPKFRDYQRQLLRLVWIRVGLFLLLLLLLAILLGFLDYIFGFFLYS